MDGSHHYERLTEFSELKNLVQPDEIRMKSDADNASRRNCGVIVRNPFSLPIVKPGTLALFFKPKKKGGTDPGIATSTM